MKRVAVVGALVLVMVRCFGCATDQRAATESDASVQDGAGPSELDAATSPGVLRPDAGKGGAASVDLHFLLIAALLETERSLVARCPCLTADGSYESTADCVKSVSIGRNWIECTSQLDLSGHDDALVRENLRCNITELTRRTECLMGSGCRGDAVASCMTQSLGCPVLPWDIFSQVATECSIAFSH